MSGIQAPAAALRSEIRLAQAIAQVEGDLTAEQLASLSYEKRRWIDSPPDIHAVMRIVAEIDSHTARQVGRGHPYGTRLVNFLEAVQQFAALWAVVLGASQNAIACSLWSLVQVILRMVLNIPSSLDKLSECLMVAGRSAPRYPAMALLYLRSEKLQACLTEYFLVAVRMCHHFLKLTRKPMASDLVSSQEVSDMRSYQSDFEWWANTIQEEVNLLMTQQLQDKEQNYPVWMLSMNPKFETIRREKLEKHLRILDACSTFDYQTAWKEIRRSGNTNWFALQREYQDWKDSSESCTLLYFGKPGSGKSVSLANMVDDLNLYGSGSAPVAYFFCRHDVPGSLLARTILGSLARQLLCTVEELTTDYIGDTVVPTLGVPDILRSLRGLKSTVGPTYRAHFVLDGLDECDEDEKSIVISYLWKIQCMFPLLVCLSLSRDADIAHIQQFEDLTNPTTLSIPENNPDIAEYIQAELERRLRSEALMLAKPTLLQEIQTALLKRAQGVFLWVVLQINSLYRSKSDEEIRQALANPPSNLPDTFSRALEQSAAQGNLIQRRTLQLITAACRPLTTEELREALGVVPGDVHFNQTLMPIDIDAALSYCGSLVTVDEETLSVTLIHQSIKQFLLSSPEGMTIQTFTARHANQEMAGIVVLYLNYYDFQTRPSTIVTPQARHGGIQPMIVRSTLKASSSVVQRLASRFLRSPKSPRVDLSKTLGEVERPDMRRLRPTNRFPFLAYVKVYWAQHILLGLEQNPDIYSGQIKVYESLRQALDRDALVVDGTDDLGRTPLSWAAATGCDAVVQMLLEKGAAINSKDGFGRTPLSWAIEGGHETVAQLLHKSGADIDSMGDLGQRPQLLATGAGRKMALRSLAHFAVVPMRRQRPPSGPWEPEESDHSGPLHPITPRPQLLPPSGPWKLEESHLAEPLHSVHRSRDGTIEAIVQLQPENRANFKRHLDHGQKLGQDASTESIDEELLVDMKLGDVHHFGKCWTCSPTDSSAHNVPISISGVPVVIPVESRYPLRAPVSPPPDPHPKFIDPTVHMTGQLVSEVFAVYEDALGFYLLINGHLQIIVPDDFDYEYALSHRPREFGGLEVSYIMESMTPTAGISSQVSTAEPSVPTQSVPGPSSTATQPPAAHIDPMLRMTIGAAIQVSVKGSKLKDRFEGRVGVMTRMGDRTFVTIPTHVVTSALTAAKSPSFPGDSWIHDVEIVSSNGNSELGPISETFDPAAGHFPVGFMHDISLVDVSKAPADLVGNIKTPIPTEWLSNLGWQGIKYSTTKLHLLKHVSAEPPRQASIKSIGLLECQCQAVGQGIFRMRQPQRPSRFSLESLRRLGKTTDARQHPETWTGLVARSLLFRIHPDFRHDGVQSGTALCMVEALEDGTRCAKVAGFTAFAQDVSVVQNFDLEGPRLYSRLEQGRVAFFGAFQVPEALRENHCIV